jgi:hypothetical protein
MRLCEPYSLCITGCLNEFDGFTMEHPHSNEIVSIVLDLAMIHQSILELTFRRPMPDTPDAVRRISRSRSLRICNGAIPNESVFQP